MNRFFTTIILTFFSCTLIFAQEPVEEVSDDALEGWLQQYATMMADSTLSENTEEVSDSIAREHASEVLSTPVVATKTTTVKTSKTKKKAVASFKQPGDILSQADSMELRRRAILESVYNPIFLDWVFYSEPAVADEALSETDSMENALRQEAREYVFQSAPELFTYHSDELPDINEILGDKLNTVKKESIMMETNAIALNPNEKIVVAGPKQSYWSFGSQFSVQASQLYISSNWYNGGESNLNSLIYIKAFAKYDDKQRIQWENTGEFKAGFISAGNDSLRMFRVNDDMLKFNTKLGVKAFGTFYYTAEAEFQTQLFNTFIPNTYERSTAAFSPIRFYLSLGMDYKYKDCLSIFVSPVSYKLVYVADTTVIKGTIPPVDPANNIASKVGIEAGKKSLNQVGGLLRINYKHKFNDDINVETKFSFYANYVGQKKGVEMDWEVVGNFIINRFLSARISVNPRYDTTIVLPEGEKNKIQFKELISFGFNYKL